MPKHEPHSQVRVTPLSRERIVQTAIQMLDGGGEGALTFRALAERLETGAGAIYWHIANKHDLLTAAADLIVASALNAGNGVKSPEKRLRAVAIKMFEAMDAHPWIGSVLAQSPGSLPMARMFDRIGAQVRRLDVPPEQQWPVTSAFVHYILGVGGQNAANSKMANEHGLERTSALTTVAAAWQGLDPDEFPVARSMAPQLMSHDDREDFITGVMLLIAGVTAAGGVNGKRG